jgi:hypothetical protein
MPQTKYKPHTNAEQLLIPALSVKINLFCLWESNMNVHVSMIKQMPWRMCLHSIGGKEIGCIFKHKHMQKWAHAQP